MATIRKRGNLQWEARIRRKGYPVTCKTFETKNDAEIWARQIEGEMDRGIFISRAEAENTTLQEALERYQKEYVPHLSHSENVLSRVKLLQRRSIASRFLATIRGKDIAEFIRERESEGVSANTIRLDLATLSKIFEIASKDWGMESLSNPVKKVNKPKLPNGRVRRFEKNEEKMLIDACTSQFRFVVLFAIETAMRREEISTLVWNNINFEKYFATLQKTKNGEVRTVPLSNTAIEILNEIRKQCNDTNSIFNMSSSAITHAMEKATKRAKINNLHFHDLRHEAISRFFENTDLDIMEIRMISGHKTLQMLTRYTHLRVEKIVNRLSGAKRGNT